MAKSELNISSSQGAVSAMLACINIYRLIPPLLSLAAPLENRVPLFQDIRRPHGTVITHYPKHVLKKIYDAESFFSKFGTSFEDVKVSQISFLMIWLLAPKAQFPACLQQAAHEVAQSSPYLVHSEEPPSLSQSNRRLRLTDGTYTKSAPVYYVKVSSFVEDILGSIGSLAGGPLRPL